MQDHLKAIGELQNMILSHMIADIQKRIEYNNILQDLQLNCEESEKFATFRETYGDSVRLEGICALRSIEGDE